jgi:hypothetical protein
MSGGEAAKPGTNLPHSHRGRSGSEKRRRGVPVGFRATEGELAEIDALAERAGLTRSSFARASMLAAPEMPATRRPPVEREVLAAILAQLGKCGSNLNQIARQLNSGGDADIPYIEEAVLDFRAACALCAAALGHPFAEESALAGHVARVKDATPARGATDTRDATPARRAARAREVA